MNRAVFLNRGAVDAEPFLVGALTPFGFFDELIHPLIEGQHLFGDTLFALLHTLHTFTHGLDAQFNPIVDHQLIVEVFNGRDRIVQFVLECDEVFGFPRFDPLVGFVP